MLEQLPWTAAAFRRGQISSQHVAVIRRAMEQVAKTCLDPSDVEPALVFAARQMDTFELDQHWQQMRYRADQEAALEGPTDLSNLELRCDVHHGRLHPGEPPFPAEPSALRHLPIELRARSRLGHARRESDGAATLRPPFRLITEPGISRPALTVRRGVERGGWRAIQSEGPACDGVARGPLRLRQHMARTLSFTHHPW